MDDSTVGSAYEELGSRVSVLVASWQESHRQALKDLADIRSEVADLRQRIETWPPEQVAVVAGIAALVYEAMSNKPNVNGRRSL